MQMPGNANNSENRPYRVYLFSYEPNVPPHVPVNRDRASCKVWLKPMVVLASRVGFNAREFLEIEWLIIRNRSTLLSAWADFHGKSQPPCIQRRLHGRTSDGGSRGWAPPLGADDATDWFTNRALCQG
jgi:hypothetical protein